MKGQGKYPNFYQICSAVSITNFVFILYYATPIVSVLLPIQSYCRDTGCLALVLQLLYYCHPINRAAYSGGGNAKKALLLTLSKQGFS
jgi:hypothetical protein